MNWYQGFHEIVLYPDDFLSPQRHRDASGVEHEWDGEHSGEAWQQGPIILAWPGVLASGGWEAYNLVIHELAHKLDMLNGDANGLPPLHSDMRISDWAQVMQAAYDDLNHQLDHNPDAETAIDPYAAENPRNSSPSPANTSSAPRTCSTKPIRRSTSNCSCFTGRIPGPAPATAGQRPALPATLRRPTGTRPQAK